MERTNSLKVRDTVHNLPTWELARWKECWGTRGVKNILKFLSPVIQGKELGCQGGKPSAEDWLRNFILDNLSWDDSGLANGAVSMLPLGQSCQRQTLEPSPGMNSPKGILAGNHRRKVTFSKDSSQPNHGLPATPRKNQQKSMHKYRFLGLTPKTD